MADTVRTISSILTLLADNTTGDISPQDLRDAVVSLQPSIGGLYVSSSAATTISLANTPVKAAGTTTAFGGLVNMDMPADNRLRNTSGVTQTYLIIVSASMTTTGSNEVVSLHIYKNGSPVTGSEQQRKVGSGSDVGNAGTIALVSLADTDYIEVWVENNTDTDNITLDYLTVIAVGVPT